MRRREFLPERILPGLVVQRRLSECDPGARCRCFHFISVVRQLRSQCVLRWRFAVDQVHCLQRRRSLPHSAKPTCEFGPVGVGAVSIQNDYLRAECLLFAEKFDRRPALDESPA